MTLPILLASYMQMHISSLGLCQLHKSAPLTRAIAFICGEEEIFHFILFLKNGPNDPCQNPDFHFKFQTITNPEETGIPFKGNLGVQND
jgi:hypothetical protein